MKFYLNSFPVLPPRPSPVVLILVVFLSPIAFAAGSLQNLEQRLSLVETYLNSKSAFRIEEGDNPQAIAFLDKAKQFLQQGSEAMQAGQLEQAAEAVDQSMRAYRAASEAARGKRATGGNAAANKVLLAEIETYHQAFMAALREKGPSMSGLLNQGQYKRLMKQARAAQQSGDGATATNRLNQAKIMVINALTKIRSNETVVYSKEFQTPADEYRYEEGRYAEYVKLAQEMLSQKELDGPKLDMLKALRSKADGFKSEAQARAEAGDFEAAIEQQEQALKKLVQGLRLLGLPVSL